MREGGNAFVAVNHSWMAKISSKEVVECCLTRSELFYNDIGKNKLAPEFTKCGSCCSIFFLCAVCCRSLFVRVFFLGHSIVCRFSVYSCWLSLLYLQHFYYNGWEDSDDLFVLDQNALMDLHSANSLKQWFAHRQTREATNAYYFGNFFDSFT